MLRPMFASSVNSLEKIVIELDAETYVRVKRKLIRHMLVI